MAETSSEKVVKDSLNRMLDDGELIYFQKVSSPRYQAEPIDFLAVTLDGRSHLIEVKENSGHSIPPSQFKDHQQKYLTQGILQPRSVEEKEEKTIAWVIAYFYRNDVQRNHTNFFSYYFLCPGIYASPDYELSVNECRSSEDCTMIGGWEHGSWVGMDEEAGLSTKGNPTLGFTGGIPLE